VSGGVQPYSISVSSGLLLGDRIHHLIAGADGTQSSITRLQTAVATKLPVSGTIQTAAFSADEQYLAIGAGGKSPGTAP
jgi:hypothetical protein